MEPEIDTQLLALAIQRTFGTPEYQEYRAMRALGNLYREVEEKEYELEEKREQRNILESEAAACRGALSTLRQFPPEILSEIFSYYMTDYAFPEKYSFVPGWVCRHWRKVALATPALWSSLYLIRTPAILISIESIRWALSKSLNQPLGVALNWPLRWTDRKTAENWLLVWDAITAELGRMEWLRIIDVHSSWAPAGERITQGPLQPPPLAPRLRSLEVFFPYPHEPDEATPWVLSLIRACSVLQELEWGRSDITGLCRLGLPLGTLTSLIVDDCWCTANELMLLLHSTPLLESCKAVFYEPDEEEEDGSVSFAIKLDHLTSFHVSGAYPLADIFNNLTTPKLDKLNISCEPERRWPQQSFMAFLSRSKSRLTSFTSNVRSIPGDDVVEWLESEQFHPSLKELDLLCHHRPHITRNAVLNHLTIIGMNTLFPPQTPALPNLTKLHLAVEISNQYDELEGLLFSRTVDLYTTILCADDGHGDIEFEIHPTIVNPELRRLECLKDIHILLLAPSFQHTSLCGGYSRSLEYIRERIEEVVPNASRAVRLHLEKRDYRCWLDRESAQRLVDVAVHPENYL